MSSRRSADDQVVPLSRDDFDLSAWCRSIVGSPTTVEPLFPGAGRRRYLRVRWASGCAVAVRGSQPREFASFRRLAGELSHAGVPVPDVIASSPRRLWMLLTDLGDPALPSLRTSRIGFDRYAIESATALARLHDVPYRKLSAQVVSEGMLLELQALWRSYVPACDLRLGRSDVNALSASSRSLVRRLATSRQSLVHGDYHARNILLGAAGEVGVIDFQDARAGCPLVDVAAFAADHNEQRPWSEIEMVIDACGDAGVLSEAERRESLFDALAFWHLRLLGRLSELRQSSGRAMFAREMANAEYYLREIRDRPETKAEVQEMLIRLLPRV